MPRPPATFPRRRRPSDVHPLDLPDRYRLILCDLWGCVHDGWTIFPGVPALLRAWKDQGRSLLFVTNAPRSADAIRRQLDGLGLAQGIEDGIVTAGEAGLAAVRGRPVGFCGTPDDRCDLEARGLIVAEVGVLKRLTENVERPYAVVLGGSKVSDKLGVIRALLPKVDSLLVGGGMCFTFLAALGHSVGASLLESEMIDTCKGLLAEGGDRIVLPTDVVVADRFAADAATQVVAADAIPAGKMGLDIGPETRKLYASKLADAATVFWNGPMGVFEHPDYAEGTKAVAQALLDSPGFTVVGGGDSAAAVRTLGFDEQAFGHISTGGGASLEYLEGKTLPGLAALED